MFPAMGWPAESCRSNSAVSMSSNRRCILADASRSKSCSKQAARDAEHFAQNGTSERKCYIRGLRAACAKTLCDWMDQCAVSYGTTVVRTSMVTLDETLLRSVAV